MSDPPIWLETCPVDGTDFVEAYEGEPPQIWFRCRGPAEHTFQSAFDGIAWSPIDTHSYE